MPLNAIETFVSKITSGHDIASGNSFFSKVSSGHDITHQNLFLVKVFGNPDPSFIREQFVLNRTNEPTLEDGPNWFGVVDGTTRWIPGTIYNNVRFVRYRIWDGTKWQTS